MLKADVLLCVYWVRRGGLELVLTCRSFYKVNPGVLLTLLTGRLENIVWDARSSQTR